MKQPHEGWKDIQHHKRRATSKNKNRTHHFTILCRMWDTTLSSNAFELERELSKVLWSLSVLLQSEFWWVRCCPLITQLSTKVIIKTLNTVFFLYFYHEKLIKSMDSSNKLFLLDAYALIYRAITPLSRTQESIPKDQHFSYTGFCKHPRRSAEKENPTHIGVAFDPAGPTFRQRSFRTI